MKNLIVVTGGAGFIGSQLILGLNERGETNILVVDDLTDGKKFHNLVDLEIADYIDKDEFLLQLKDEKFCQAICRNIRAIFHQGANSTTTDWDGKAMMENNYSYSKQLLEISAKYEIPLIYASSAAVYGGSNCFIEEPKYEKPLNVYGYSKLLFDRYAMLQQQSMHSQVVGLRYFNVYGPGEQHKGSMSSVAFHLDQQLKNGADEVKLFGACDGYEAGQQRRDFIYVKDVVAVNLWMLDHPEVSGVFNCGTGRSQTFQDVAQAVIDYHQQGKIAYVEFPEHLKGAYQSFTEADLSKLRSVGCDVSFSDVAAGVHHYLSQLREV